MILSTFCETNYFLCLSANLIEKEIAKIAQNILWPIEMTQKTLKFPFRIILYFISVSLTKKIKSKLKKKTQKQLKRRKKPCTPRNYLAHNMNHFTIPSYFE